jgi:hypothetical protein
MKRTANFGRGWPDCCAKVIEEAEERGEPDIAELLRLALLEVVRSPSWCEEVVRQS